MEIRSIRQTAGFSAASPARTADTNGSTGRTAAADRVELSRRWVAQMEEQRVQMTALLSGEKRKDKEYGGILDYMETEQDKLDAMSEHLKVQQKCLKIAMRIMQGKKVPPEDERYLMENDPEGYKLVMALRKPPKKDEEECESVLDDEDKKSGKTSGGGEAAPVEASTGGGEASASGEGSATE